MNPSTYLLGKWFWKYQKLERNKKKKQQTN